jgi:hypothetical protein
MNPDAVVTLYLQGESDHCGCAEDCGCAPHFAQIPPQYHVPQEAASHLTLSELNEVCRGVNQILESTHLPAFLAMFLHFCLPFSPICAMRYFKARQNRLLAELVTTLNREVFVDRNCHW